MIGSKNIEISHDASTWPSSKVPSDIRAISTTRSTNIDRALIHTALWTRPPTSHGFNLHDVWAWLRYGRAISAKPDLRLRSEWNDIDPHQKTVLSDELGVGFTTQLLIEELGYKYFADTRYVMSVLRPGLFKLGKSTKVGPQKSPDYIGWHKSGKFGVLECKGSQSNRKAIYKAINKGITQKKNVTAKSSRYVEHSLVAGLYVPQFRGKEKSLIHLCDPPCELFDEIHDNKFREGLTVAIVQIVLAKQFAMVGDYEVANWLSLTPTMSLHKENSSLSTVVGDSDARERERSIELPGVILGDNEPENGYHRSLSMSLTREVHERIFRTDNLYNTLLEFSNEVRGISWDTTEIDGKINLSSPLGLVMSLS